MPIRLQAGEPAPDFALPRDGGGEVCLADYRDRKLILYFYPKADTSGCTKEAIDFTRLTPQFTEAGAAVLGVSADPVKALDRFKAKHNLGVALASDETLGMLKSYGVWAAKSMYGRSFMGVVRSTFLIGPDGRIVRIWDKVKVPGHAEEVLAAVRAM